MRYLYASVFVVMIMALSACSSADETKKIVEKESVVEEKESGINQEAWEGEWIFLSDESVGTLKISNLVDQQFDYVMGATVMLGEEPTPFATGWKGTGLIKGNEATVSNEIIEDCKVKFILDGDQMTVESMDESCQTEKIELTGTYKKKDAIKAEPFWGIKDQAFYISGITLKMSPGQVKAVLANPDYEGPDLGYYNWRQEYPDLSMTYGSNKIIASINATVEKDKLKELLASTADMEQYEGDDGTLYYYAAKSSQLLILKDFNENQEVHDLMLSTVDENFWYHVEVGSIKKVE